MNKKHIDYLFEDEDSGELFFVEIAKDSSKSYTDCFNEAWKIAEENFNNLFHNLFLIFYHKIL